MKEFLVKHWARILVAVALIGTVSYGVFIVKKLIDEKRMLREVIGRLNSETRIAEVLVTKSEYEESSKKIKTTIKFLEFDTRGKPLKPRYFTFKGNIIQFQSLVVRFEDSFVMSGDKLRGKSIYLFLKAFVLDEQETQIFTINPTKGVPAGYQVFTKEKQHQFEEKIWAKFWDYALDPRNRAQAGIKNAQIEAPGSLFLPGTIYKLILEYDGGLRIDASPIPEILKGETVNQES